MRVAFHFLFSLTLAVLLSFAIPVVLVGGVSASLMVLGYVPSLDALAQSGMDTILQFLNIFGNGSPANGLLTVGFTSSLAGGLFQMGTFYRYQHL
ncbi:hypothetical protein [Lusitaniella coriacea]|uniref:hypothetical protein n=1 Tax=Lusitaniella coriacea TaxID=1983105 RepID=UPI003CF4085F